MKHAPKPSSAAGRKADVQVDESALRAFAGYHMKRAFNVVMTDLNRTLKPFGLRMTTFTALQLIADNPGLRQSQLADAMEVERPNMVVIIDELERRDLILRDRVPTDRRAYALKATLAGRRLCQTAGDAVRANEARVFSGWTEEERATVIAAMDAIRRRPEEENQDEGESRIRHP